MTKLTICIPVEPGGPPPARLVNELLKDPHADIDVIVATYEAACSDILELQQRATQDKRLEVLTPAPQNVAKALFWLATVASATGDWVTIVLPGDSIDPELVEVLTDIEQTLPQIDALAWTSGMHPHGAAADGVSPEDSVQNHTSADRNATAFDCVAIEKDRMLGAFFQWTGSRQVPDMPFGLYHGAIRRTLLDTIISTGGPSSWMTPLPQYEWSARILIFASSLGFCPRPLSSAQSIVYAPQAVRSAAGSFPFNASLGITAAVAEIQCRLLHELGMEWTGFTEDFLQACMLDCMIECDTNRLYERCQAYVDAICRMEDGRSVLAHSFLPDFLNRQHDAMVQGLASVSAAADLIPDRILSA